ncbi:hypothetical protein L6452_01449 [Arctium lappa]|uniref:Uncharacterized protein n=1 Tax=Arctium lappa TaxID=4217 RepID=A0ACB9FI05_ARCLA|nr:hypothetical protein L6452_01449 [Arctium lappa]
MQEAGVQNVTVTTTMFKATENGVRIKTWARESNGGCPEAVSGVSISDVRYDDIHGTSATEVDVKLDCIEERPCSGIKMEDVNLSYNN